MLASTEVSVDCLVLRLSLAQIHIAARRAGSRCGAKRPMVRIVTAPKGRCPNSALVLDIGTTQTSLSTPSLVAGHITVFVIIWDFQGITSAQITLLLTRSFDPRDVAAATVWTTIVEEAGVGGELGVAVGVEAFLKCARSNSTETHENGFHGSALCAAVSLTGRDNHDCDCDCQRDCNSGNSVSGSERHGPERRPTRLRKGQTRQFIV